MTSKKRDVSRVVHENRLCLKHVFIQTIIYAILAPIVACGAQNGGSTSVSSQQQTSQLPQSLGPGDYERMISIDNQKRYYSVHVPPSYDKRRATPIVLNFHGGAGNPKSQKHISKMDQVSDRCGFIAVYPQGTNRALKLHKGYTWNAGTCCGWAQENKIDDVAFVSALLDDLSKVLNADSKRVYATGISNGAMLCYRLACELTERIAAIAPVSGPMGAENCHPLRPISIMHFHGTEDNFAPYGGGRGSKSFRGQHFRSVEESIDFWLNFLNIKGKPKVVRMGDAIGEYYGPGRSGSEVVLWKIKGGGHTWPGGQFGILKERFLGKMTQDIFASDLMWEFFQKHPLP